MTDSEHQLLCDVIKLINELIPVAEMESVVPEAAYEILERLQCVIDGKNY